MAAVLLNEGEDYKKANNACGMTDIQKTIAFLHSIKKVFMHPL